MRIQLSPIHFVKDISGQLGKLLLCESSELFSCRASLVAWAIASALTLQVRA